jgi:hypothetical protein
MDECEPLVIARAGNLVGAEDGALFAVARGAAAVLRRGKA